jgi:uncharacterized membrane protein
VRLNASELLSRLTSSYWFVPLMVTAGGALLAPTLLVLDARISWEPDGPLGVFRAGSADGARALLSAVVGAMITAISVTFSVTIVALTVAAQHFGPRVLNSFVRQVSSQVVLGTFMATFLYSVLALGAIRGSGPDAEIPELTVAGAVVLVIISIGALIYYVHHVSTTLQIGQLAAAISVDLRGSVSNVDAQSNTSEAAGGGDQEPATDTLPETPPDAAPVPAQESGYIQRIDHAGIAEQARVHGALVWIRREPGAFVVAGTPLALVHPPHACDETLVRAVHAACIVGRDRTYWQDPEFAVKQLVEIALRALSPGVNEPFTTITCIDRLTEGLASVLTAPRPPSAWPDSTGRLRLFVQPQTFDTLLRAAFDPIRLFAGPNPAIYVRLLDSLAELGLVAERATDRQRLRDQAEVIWRAADRALVDADDRGYFEGRYAQAVRQLDGQPASSRR